jgi:hypothetical protein
VVSDFEAEAVGDLNGDGRPDVALADFFTGQLFVLLGTPPLTGACTQSNMRGPRGAQWPAALNVLRSP